MFTVSILLSTFMGIFRSYTTSYETFIIFEVLDALVTSGSYCACFILGKFIFYVSEHISVAKTGLFEKKQYFVKVKKTLI